MGSSFALACSCSSKPQKQPEPKPEEKQMEQNTPSEQKGPQQEPFQSCGAIDSECEEGASSDVLKQTDQAPLAAGSYESAIEPKEQALFVTPIVVEAVQMQVSEKSDSIAKETKPEAKEIKAVETASTSSPESVS